MDFREYARALERQWRDGPREPPAASLITLRSVASTHRLARRIAEEYGRENLVPPAVDIVAWEQTEGVGREGRTWSSPGGKGVYLTLVRVVAGSARIQTLPLSVPVALCEALNRLVVGAPRPRDAPCRIKWPNDLQVGDRKIGGILIDVLSSGTGRRPPSGSEPSVVKERRARRRGTSVAVLSVGANLARDLGAFGEPRATSIDLEAARRDRGPFAAAAVAEALASAMSGAVRTAEPVEEVLERYRRFSVHRPGEPMRCRVDSEVVDGTFEGFDRLGFLELRVGGERRRISSGVVVRGE